jgi:phosphoglycolate phosphatase-like HAD superfamily hydrolase
MSTILFDFDGTIADTRSAYVLMLVQAFNKANITTTPEEVSRKLVPSIKKTIEGILADQGIEDAKLVSKLEGTTISLLSSEWMDLIRINKNIKDLLDNLYDEGHDLYLVSNSHSSFVLPALAKFGLGKYFREVLTLDSGATDKADMILGLAVKLGELVIDITYIADTLMDVKLAEEVGCKFLLLITPISWDFSKRTELVDSIIGKSNMRVADGVQNAKAALIS